MAYDLILHGGHVIDPSQEIDGKLDVAFSDGKVAALGPDLAATSRTDVRDVRRKAGAHTGRF